MCLQGHMGRVGEERCAYVRALVVANRALMSRGHLEEQADNWLAQSGTLPPGNGVERDLWEVRFFLSPLPFPSPSLCRKVAASVLLHRFVLAVQLLWRCRTPKPEPAFSGSKDRYPERCSPRRTRVHFTYQIAVRMSFE